MQIKIIASWLIAVACFLVIGWWYSDFIDRPVVLIEAAHDVPENGLAVFGQFVVTQSLAMSDVAKIVALQIPIYFPSSNAWLHVELRRNGHMIQQWQAKPQESLRVTEVYLPLLSPQLLDGQLEVILNGQHIRYEDRDAAPKVFVESADDNYSGGNYRIAQNEKKGDVEMTIFETVSRGHMWRERLVAKPFATVFESLIMMAGILVLSGFPFLFSNDVGSDSGTS